MHSTSLQAQGFRFVYRAGYGCGYTWTHSAEMQATDIDCTDMGDDEFEQFVRVREAAKRVGNELSLHQEDDQFSRDLQTLVGAVT